jgi:hypothetical protein
MPFFVGKRPACVPTKSKKQKAKKKAKKTKKAKKARASRQKSATKQGAELPPTSSLGAIYLN